MRLPEDLHCLILRQCLTSLATANRWRVSIRGRPCKIFTHIYFDHHAKFRCCFSYCVDACKRSLADAEAPPTWDGDVADRLETRYTSPHVSSYHISLP